MIDSPRTYLIRNWRVITWMSNYSCPVWTFCNWIAAIRCTEMGSPTNYSLNCTPLSPITITNCCNSGGSLKDHFLSKSPTNLSQGLSRNPVLPPSGRSTWGAQRMSVLEVTTYPTCVVSLETILFFCDYCFKGQRGRCFHARLCKTNTWGSLW